MISIQQIRDRAEQGVTKPFLCQGDDGHWYFVKGRGAGMRSLICEWIAGRMAQAFGLPVAPFAQVDVPEALIQTALRPELTELGAGIAFASRQVRFPQEFSRSHLPRVASQLGEDVRVFDWWVRNQDRTLTQHGGNPNLLWDQASEALVVIDHNQAFDPAFDPQAFVAQHVFAAPDAALCHDLMKRAAYFDRFALGMAAFDAACEGIPESWWWVDAGVPVDFDPQCARAVLTRYTLEEFWSIT